MIISHILPNHQTNYTPVYFSQQNTNKINHFSYFILLYPKEIISLLKYVGNLHHNPTNNAETSSVSNLLQMHHNYFGTKIRYLIVLNPNFFLQYWETGLGCLVDPRLALKSCQGIPVGLTYWQTPILPVCLQSIWWPRNALRDAKARIFQRPGQHWLGDGKRRGMRPPPADGHTGWCHVPRPGSTEDMGRSIFG